MPGLSLGLIHSTVKTHTGTTETDARDCVSIDYKLQSNQPEFTGGAFNSLVAAFRNPAEDNPAVFSSGILRKRSPVWYIESLEHEAVVKSKQY